MKKIKLLALLSILISSTMYGDIKLDGSKLQNTTIEQGKKGNTINKRRESQKLRTINLEILRYIFASSKNPLRAKNK